MADYRAAIEGMTIPDVVDRAAAERDGEALVFPDERVTWRELADRSRSVAAGLHGLGIGPGDHVAYMMVNGVDIVAVMVGVMRLGAVAVPVNARYKGAEIAHVVSDAAVAAVIVDDVYLRDAAGALAQRSRFESLRHVIGGDGAEPGFVAWSTLRDADPRDAERDVDAAAMDPDALAMILYTSGTTARPKGVMHSQASILGSSASLAERLELRADDRWWSPLPLFHIAAIATLNAVFIAGCTLVHAGFFEPGVAVRQLSTERCTLAFPAFETIWLAVLDHPDFADADFSALERVVNIGIPERLRAMQERLPSAVQVSATGSTESGGFLAIGQMTDTLAERVNTNGHVLPGMEVKIRDIETGEDRGPGSTGELLYRGPSRLMGYWADPEVTAERIDADGWFCSGDVFRWDTDGRITFVERLKDMLKVGGENVAAAEIEDFVAAHPAVRIVAVVAAPDARYVEVPCAFVQAADGVEVTEAEIVEFCRGEIATFKVPRYVRFVDDFPMSGTKIQKYRLREIIASELAEAGITEAPRISST